MLHTALPDEQFARRLALAHARSPGIRRIFQQAGVPVEEVCTPADLVRLPVTPKEQLAILQGDAPPFGGFPGGRGAARPGGHRDPGRGWRQGAAGAGALRHHLQEAYGIDAYQGYGTAELGILAYECAERRGMHLVETVVVEILDPETREPVPTGVPGEVVVTSLGETFPLVRPGTGDLASVLPGDCPCGRPAPRIRGILGRAGEAVTKPRARSQDPTRTVAN